MAENLPAKLKYTSQKLHDAVAEYERELIRLQGLLNEGTGVIMTPEKYPLEKLSLSSPEILGRSPYGSYNEATPERALAVAQQAYEESLPLVMANKAICAHNAKIINTLVGLITNAGIPDYEVKYTTSRGKTKSERVTAAWKNLGAGISTSDNWDALVQRYETFKKDCANWRARLDNVKSQQQAEETRKKNAARAEIDRIARCIKLGIDPNDPDADSPF